MRHEILFSVSTKWLFFKQIAKVIFQMTPFLIIITLTMYTLSTKLNVVRSLLQFLIHENVHLQLSNTLFIFPPVTTPAIGKRHF